MQEANRLKAVNPAFYNNSNQLPAALVMMAGAVILFFIWLLFDESNWQINIDYQLLPWIGATALVLLAPSFYLIYRGKFDIFHPLVYASWGYWFPSFIIGGLFIATDFLRPYQMSLVNDPRNDLILTYIYIMVGYASMSVGFYLPLGKWLGQYAAQRLPAWDWQPQQVLLPAVVFLGIGLFFYVSAFFSGVVGASLTNTQDVFSTLNYTMSFLSLEAGFLVAMYIFMSRGIKFEHILAFSLILILLISRLSLGANRSSIVLIVILLAMAYFYSGRRLTVTTGVIFAALTVLAVLGGMIYGTTFRHLKGSEERTDMSQQLDTVGDTVILIGNQDTGKILNESFSNLAERIDGVSSLAVVVSNYERLKPYEAAYGIENNIYTDLGTSFIPRFIWKDKPLISDVRAYSDLYFNFSGNSYALTPVGDLLRNFGPFGVPLGMMLVGIFLRFAYSALIENKKITIGRATAYYLFLSSLTYEGFYSTTFIYGVRVFIIVYISFYLAERLLISNVRNHLAR